MRGIPQGVCVGGKVGEAGWKPCWGEAGECKPGVSSSGLVGREVRASGELKGLIFFGLVDSGLSVGGGRVDGGEGESFSSSLPTILKAELEEAAKREWEEGSGREGWARDSCRKREGSSCVPTEESSCGV